MGFGVSGLGLKQSWQRFSQRTVNRAIANLGFRVYGLGVLV